MNLSGFCAADPAQCGVPRGSATPPPAALVAAAQVNPQTAPIFGAVRNGLYRIAAAIGRNVVCPLLPLVGEGLGATAGAAIGIAETSFTIGGVVFTVGLEELGRAIGRVTGVAVQREICVKGD